MTVEIRFYQACPSGRDYSDDANDYPRPYAYMVVDAMCLGMTLNNYAVRYMHQFNCIGYHIIQLDNAFHSGGSEPRILEGPSRW